MNNSLRNVFGAVSRHMCSSDRWPNEVVNTLSLAWLDADAGKCCCWQAHDWIDTNVADVDLTSCHYFCSCQDGL